MEILKANLAFFKGRWYLADADELINFGSNTAPLHYAHSSYTSAYPSRVHQWHTSSSRRKKSPLVVSIDKYRAESIVYAIVMPCGDRTLLDATQTEYFAAKVTFMHSAFLLICLCACASGALNCVKNLQAAL